MEKRKRPILFGKDDREASLKQDTPAVFSIQRDPKNIKWDLVDEIRTFDSLGKKAVREHDHLISKSAQKNNVDPDLIRSVMYAENSRGHKFGFNALADTVHMSDSIMPMNIQKEKWSGITGRTLDDLYDPKHNIEASTVLLKRIAFSDK